LIDTYQRIRALVFEVNADVVESLGAEKYVHFKIEGAGAQSAQLEAAAESEVGENEFVARVSTESKVTQGQTLQLAFDTSKIAIFDADTGVNLTIEPAGSQEPAPAPTPAPESPAEPAEPAAPPPPPPSEQTPPAE
ncbi:MAG TPA: ABC transporter ATP-binding protein, partial [Mycobacterium sp.]